MTLDFQAQRDKDFMEAYDRLLKSYGKQATMIKKEVLIMETINSPAKRFYVSEEQALKMIRKALIHKKKLSSFLRIDLKIEMYEEIINRIKKILPNKPTTKDYEDAIFDVVNNPAPRFYIGYHAARFLLSDLIKKHT